MRITGTSRDDDGFTLIELVITVAIVAIISMALIGTVWEYLRLGNQTSTRLNESTDQEFVSAYWQQDVSSLGDHGFAVGAAAPIFDAQAVWQGALPPGLPASCASLVTGTPLISLAWSEYPGDPDSTITWTNKTPNYAIYFTSGAQMYRVRCGTTSTKLIVARHLDPSNPPTTACADASGAVVGCPDATHPAPPWSVSMTISVRDATQAVPASTAYRATLKAQRRQG